MPIGLVVPVVLVGWATACALTSWRRLGGVARVPALVVNELPFLAGYVLVASTLLALAQGDLGSVGGVIVGVVVLVELLGLLVIVRRALRADAALHNPTPPRRPWHRILIAPLPAVRREMSTSPEPRVRRRPAPQPRHLPPPRPSGRRTGGAALPRRRLSLGQQAPRGPTVDRASGQSGHGLRERQLSPAPADRLRRADRRLLSCDRVGAVARPRLRRRSGPDLSGRQLGWRLPVGRFRQRRNRLGSPESWAATATTATSCLSGRCHRSW